MKRKAKLYSIDRMIDTVQINAVLKHRTKSQIARSKNLFPDAFPRRRGWHAKFDDGPLSSMSDSVEAEYAEAKKACNRLTPDARKLGAKANALNAAELRKKIIHEIGAEIENCSPRGISALAKRHATQYGLAESTMRAHLTHIKKHLLNSR